MFQGWILVVSEVSMLVLILFSVWNVWGGFVFLFSAKAGDSIMLGYHCRTRLGHNCAVEEKLEFKGSEDVLEEMEKFFYLVDMISCYGGAFVIVSARICSA